MENLTKTYVQEVAWPPSNHLALGLLALHRQRDPLPLMQWIIEIAIGRTTFAVHLGIAAIQCQREMMDQICRCQIALSRSDARRVPNSEHSMRMG